MSLNTIVRAYNAPTEPDLEEFPHEGRAEILRIGPGEYVMVAASQSGVALRSIHKVGGLETLGVTL